MRRLAALCCLLAVGCAAPKWRYDRVNGLHDPDRVGKPAIVAFFREGMARFRAAERLVAGNPAAARGPDHAALLREAIERFHQGFDLDPDSTYADQCLFYWAESHFLLGELQEAQEPANLIIAHYEDDSRGLGRPEDFPASLWSALMRRQVDYGSALVNGEEGAFLGAGPVDGVEILKRVAVNDRWSPFADDAWMSIAAWHVGNGDFDQALTIYERVTDEYAESDRHREAIYQKGLMHLKLAPGPRYDDDHYQKARLAFDEHLGLAKASPGGFDDEARNALEETLDRQARKLLAIASHYYQQERYAAAKVYLLKILGPDKPADPRFPATPAAEEARELLSDVEAELNPDN
ncbi:MAG: outer membrane protein assembly factor BamD [Planctomycetes bacterium]|nr:outer membrane protein assembly factor BamD [Planctomycetota bacterium]